MFLLDFSMFRPLIRKHILIFIQTDGDYFSQRLNIQPKRSDRKIVGLNLSVAGLSIAANVVRKMKG
ncbi:hypothetical protein BCF53_10378 [Reinekea marinisedimentorum]|uniref:Uncharacterized protein n=1 Tax=Reinekea marinisedimentorum TaxID=230495 RepID=A0A4R3IA97_9GAMM|nr:hypothetical protein BCF53_10378 [Reinekea marinisedimentorum]